MEEHQILERLWKLLGDYLTDSRDIDGPVVEHRTPAELLKEFDFSLSREGTPLEGMLPTLAAFLKYMPRTNHPLFMNQLYSGSPLPGIAGEMAVAAANTSMATYEIAPFATLLEKALIDHMNSIAGYTNGDGIFCTGGSNGNLLGMLNARNERFPDLKMNGYGGMPPVSVFFSETAHYSLPKAANVLGIGLKNAILVPTDDKGRMIPRQLRIAIRESKARGETPFFIAATCGTTVLGAFDPLEELAEIAEEENLWLHADGAWGGPVLFSRKHSHLMAGIERTDSFSWDICKLMGAPLISTAFLTREKGQLYRTASNSGTEYLFHDDENEYDTGLKSLQCGRKVDSLKTWLIWNYYGDRGFENKVDSLFETARYAGERIKAEPKLELAAPVQYINVCFRYLPESGDADEFNVALRQHLLTSGKCMVNYSTLNGAVTLRLVLQNLEHTRAHVDRLLDLLLEEAGRLEQQ